MAHLCLKMAFYLFACFEVREYTKLRRCLQAGRKGAEINVDSSRGLDFRSSRAMLGPFVPLTGVAMGDLLD